MDWSVIRDYIKHLVCLALSPKMSLVLLGLFILIGLILLFNKAVRAEFGAFLDPLRIGAKRRFVLLLIIITIIIVLAINAFNKNHLFEQESLYFFLGLVFTCFFGVIIALKTSTNNIGKLLSRISNMLDGNTDDKEFYLILPTPFLGYLHFKNVFKKIERYLQKSRKYHLAFLDWTNNKTVYEIHNQLNKIYEEQKAHFYGTQWNDRRLTNRVIDKKAKQKSWLEFVAWAENNSLSSLFKFHLDEIQQEKRIEDEKKYDYFIEVCNFIEGLMKNAESNKDIELKRISVSYDYYETVFPIILINVNDTRILQGTTRVESQFRVRFEGDVMNGDPLCNKATAIFGAYCQ